MRVEYFEDPQEALDEHKSNPEIAFRAFHMHWEESAIAGNRKQSWENVRALKSAIQGFQNEGVPVIWTVHSDQAKEANFVRIFDDLQKFLAQNADHIIVHSRSAKIHLINQRNAPENRISIIEYPINLPSDVRARMMAATTNHGLKSLLVYDELPENEGLNRVMAALNSLENGSYIDEVIFVGKNDEAHLQQGDQPYEMRVEDITQDDEALEKHMLRASFFVLPFEQNYSSETISRANAMGLPVIAPDLGSVRDQIPPKNAHLLYNPDDPQALKAAIDRAISFSSGRVFQMKENCLEFAAVFSPQNQSEKLVELYEKLDIIKKSE